MIDSKELKRITRQVLATQNDLQMFKTLAKKANGRLTAAGKALLSQGLQDGIPPSTLARLLEITRAAVAHYE